MTAVMMTMVEGAVVPDAVSAVVTMATMMIMGLTELSFPPVLYNHFHYSYNHVLLYRNMTQILSSDSCLC